MTHDVELVHVVERKVFDDTIGHDRVVWSAKEIIEVRRRLRRRTGSCNELRPLSGLSCIEPSTASLQHGQCGGSSFEISCSIMSLLFSKTDKKS